MLISIIFGDRAMQSIVWVVAAALARVARTYDGGTSEYGFAPDVMRSLRYFFRFVRAMPIGSDRASICAKIHRDNDGISYV